MEEEETDLGRMANELEKPRNSKKGNKKDLEEEEERGREDYDRAPPSPRDSPPQYEKKRKEETFNGEERELKPNYIQQQLRYHKTKVSDLKKKLMEENQENVHLLQYELFVFFLLQKKKN